MSKGDNSPGMSKLAMAIRGLTGAEIPAAQQLDFGVIQANGSLRTNAFPVPIPKRDYTVCRSLKRLYGGFTTSPGGEPIHTHIGSVNISPALKAGDRVLIAWVGSDAIVIDVVIPASTVL